MVKEERSDQYLDTVTFFPYVKSDSV